MMQAYTQAQRLAGKINSFRGYPGCRFAIFFEGGRGAMGGESPRSWNM